MYDLIFIIILLIVGIVSLIVFEFGKTKRHTRRMLREFDALVAEMGIFFDKNGRIIK